MSEVVKVSQLVKKLSLEIVTGDEKSLDRVIVTGDISRPGLELTGYFNYYSHNRLQLFGSKEISFAERMIPEERLIIMRRYARIYYFKRITGSRRNDPGSK